MRDAKEGKRGRRYACSDADSHSRRHSSRAYRCRTRHAAENTSRGQKQISARFVRDPLRVRALATRPFDPTQRLFSPPRPFGRSPRSSSSTALAAASSESLRLVEMRTPRDAPDLSGTASTRYACVRYFFRALQAWPRCTCGALRAFGTLCGLRISSSGLSTSSKRDVAEF